MSRRKIIYVDNVIDITTVIHYIHYNNKYNVYDVVHWELMHC